MVEPLMPVTPIGLFALIIVELVFKGADAARACMLFDSRCQELRVSRILLHTVSAHSLYTWPR